MNKRKVGILTFSDGRAGWPRPCGPPGRWSPSRVGRSSGQRN